MSLGRLAAAEQVRPPTMSRIVAGLESAGLVARASHARDARQVVLRATRRGERVLHEGRRRRVAALAERVRALGPPQRVTLAAAAELIEQVLRRRDTGMMGRHPTGGRS
jgi:DNA-binding MarR family transcriptional regulator